MKATKFARGLSFALGLAMFAGSVLAAQPAQGGNPNPGIIPLNAHFHGKTYGEWLAELHKWVFRVPAADSPVFEGNEGKIANGQPKHVWFLSNAVPVTTRHFTVPAGTALYATMFSVAWDNQICVDPDSNYSVDELRGFAKSIVDWFQDIEMQVDGIPVENAAAYRAISPVFDLTTVEQICEAAPGTYGPVVADGYGLLLAPLSVGVHTIHLAAKVVPDPSDPSQNVDVDIMWYITVTPQKK